MTALVTLASAVFIILNLILNLFSYSELCKIQDLTPRYTGLMKKQPVPFSASLGCIPDFP